MRQAGGYASGRPSIHLQRSTLPSHNRLRLQTQLQGDTLAQDLPSLCVAEARYLWFRKWVRWGNEGSTFRLRTAGLRVSPLGRRGVRACVEWLLLVLRGHLHRLPWSQDTHHWRHQDLQNGARDLGTAGLDPSCIRHTKSSVSFQAGSGVAALLVRCTSLSPPICMRTLMKGQIGSVWGQRIPIHIPRQTQVNVRHS